MSTFFITLLALHVLVGVGGVTASFMSAYMLIKPQIPTSAVIKTAWSAFVLYMISWIAGGWYYWKYYGRPTVGDEVFPRGRIITGDYAWAHYIITEGKEHAFLFLPFAALVLALLVHYKGDSLLSDPVLKQRVFVLALVIAILGVVITLSGVVMSGAAR